MARSATTSTLVSLLALASTAFAQTYTATYTPDDAPKISEQGQSGTNQCGSGSDQGSMCQNVYGAPMSACLPRDVSQLIRFSFRVHRRAPTVNSLDDFCLFAPPSPGPGSVIGNTERIEVAWCVQGGHGTRVVPPGRSPARTSCRPRTTCR